MNVEVTKLPESRVALKIELSEQDVSQALDRTYKQLVQRVSIPGFRKGKAPRPVLERMIGHDLFVHEATEEAIRWGYRKAVDETGVTPIDEAEIDAAGGEHDHVEVGHSFQFEATVAVRPDVQLPDYSGITVERTTVEVTDEDVENLLQSLRERNATLEPTVRAAEIGDVLTLNIVGRVDGAEVVNNEHAEYELRDEENSGPDPYLPGLSQELIGANRGDIREPILHLPETYPNPELASKTMLVRALVTEVKRKVLPAPDNDFAISVSEFETLEELRQALRSNLELERRLEGDEKLVNDAIGEVVSRTFVEIPQILIEEETDRMLDEFRRTLESQRLSLQNFLEVTNQTEVDLRREMLEQASSNVKTTLVLSAIADTEGIEVTPRDIDAALEDLLRQARTGEAERRRLRTSSSVRSNIRSRIRRQRAIQKLVEAVASGEQISPQATEAIADQTGGTADDTEETMAVEVTG